MSKRKKYQIKDNGHMKGPALTHMRDVAYGDGMRNLIDRTVNRKPSHVVEVDTITAAERKRLRKQERNRRNG